MARHRSHTPSPIDLDRPRRRGAHRRAGPPVGRRVALVAVAAGVAAGVQTQVPATAAAEVAPVDRGPAAPDPSPLRIGSDGADVRDLQRVLNAWYPARAPLAVDGAYGPATQAAVLDLQRREGIRVDGVVGPQTRGVLGMTGQHGDGPAAAAVPRETSDPAPETSDPAPPATSDPEPAAPTTEPPPVQEEAGGEVVAPTSGRFTSGFGSRSGRSHNGIDIANAIGTPIHSTTGGVVIDTGPASGFGLWVRVRHDDGDISVYGHINESLVTTGQQVATGEQIATMGNRGRSTGPHLHFEILRGGTDKVDPRGWLREHGVEI